MRYHFHVRQNGDTALDNDLEGTELADMQAVRSEAQASIREILAASLRSGVDSRDRAMIVNDESGQAVLTVPFCMRVLFG